MRQTALVILLLCGATCFAQDPETVLPTTVRSTKSYLIAEHTPKDTAYLKAQCRRAGLDLGLEVLANRIPTDSRLVTPKPSVHLLHQDTLYLQLPINDKQTEFAVYHSEVFDLPSYINVLQIGDELVTYRTTEKSGDINLFYGCVRGAYGTKKSAHPGKAPVYKLGDTPERTLLPDLELQEQMIEEEALRLSETDYPLLIFNDLNSYACPPQGDEVIAYLLATMQKHNPDKLLQADQYTPAAWPYLSRVNENQLWGASMRIKIVKTLAEKQEYYRKLQMPWMIGNFQIHLADKYNSATPMEALEWFLAKAAAFDAGFGLDYSIETMQQHGLNEAFLKTIKAWETLRLGNAFSAEQKEKMKDPYSDWHLQQVDDSTFSLFEQQISSRYRMEPTYYDCDTCKGQGSLHGNWSWKPSFFSPMAFVVKVEGKGSISDLCLITPNSKLTFPCTIEAGQYLLYNFDHMGTALITDANYNTIAEIQPTGTLPVLSHEGTLVTASCIFNCKGNKAPEVSVRYLSRGTPETIRLRQPLWILIGKKCPFIE